MKLIGLFGHPVSHSLSPLMHNFAFEKIGLQYTYIAFDIAAEEVGNAVNSIRALNMAGCNVTIPYKQAVLPYLDEIDETAQEMGAVNTIVNHGGCLKGYNTDGAGYVMSLERETRMSAQGKEIAVIGAGGAARGIIYELLKKSPAHVTVINRNLDNARKLADSLMPFGEIQVVTDSQAIALQTADIVINTTPVGMHPNVTDMPIIGDIFRSDQIVSDIIYNPLETMFLRTARQRGARTHSGLGMFVYQGALAFELWTGVKPPVEEMYRLIEQRLLLHSFGG